MERLHNKENKELFTLPDLQSEAGEIERIGKYFNIKNKNFIEKFIKKASSLSLSSLSKDIWNNLENTDSTDVEKGNWDSVAHLSKQVHRNWKPLKARLENGDTLEAPIIAKSGKKYHLVSGNTRLMVSKALGIIPSVLIVDIEDLK